jgi:hypothetical protein
MVATAEKSFKIGTYGKLNEKIFFSVKITEGNGSNHYVIKFVNRSRSVVFSGYSVSSTNITDCNDMTEKLLKVVLNTTTLSPFKLEDPRQMFSSCHKHRDLVRASLSARTRKEETI